jgi:hypothetical protein
MKPQKYGNKNVKKREWTLGSSLTFLTPGQSRRQVEGLG